MAQAAVRMNISAASLAVVAMAGFAFCICLHVPVGVLAGVSGVVRSWHVEVRFGGSQKSEL